MTITAVPDSVFTPGELRSADGEVALPPTKVAARAAVDGLFLTWSFDVSFTNTTTSPLEAVYVLPLPGRLAVRSCYLDVDGRRVTAKLMERSHARQVYADAIDAGKHAALVEEDRPEVFSVSAGNIEPGAQVTVGLELCGTAPVVDGVADVRLPTFVADRFVDAEATPDATRVTPPRGTADLPVWKVSIESTQNPLPSTAPGGALVDGVDGEWSVSLPDALPEGDLHVRFSAPDPAAPHAVRAAGGGTDVVAATVYAPVSRPGSDVLLVVDRSGSMGGTMETAARAASRIADSLCDEDRLSLICFDHEIDEVFSSFLPATDETRFAAVRHLSNLDARGGTDMLAALRAAASQCATSTRPKVVVLVTDALISAEDAALRALDGCGDVTTHVVVIGRYANEGLATRLASVRGGTVTCVADNAALDEHLSGLCARISPPALTDVRLFDGDIELPAQHPRVRNAHEGVPLVVTAPVPDSGMSKLKVRARNHAGELVEFTPALTEVSHPAPVAAWARTRVRDLEDLRALGAVDDTLGRVPEPSDIVEFSVANSVLCRFTAFVAVDDDGAKVDGELRSVEVPSPSLFNVAGIAGAAPLGRSLGSRSVSVGSSVSLNSTVGRGESWSAGTGVGQSLGATPSFSRPKTVGPWPQSPASRSGTSAPSLSFGGDLSNPTKDPLVVLAAELASEDGITVERFDELAAASIVPHVIPEVAAVLTKLRAALVARDSFDELVAKLRELIAPFDVAVPYLPQTVVPHSTFPATGANPPARDTSRFWEA